FTILGNLDWTNYSVSTDVLFEQPGSVDLIGRLTGMSGPDVPNSYVLRVTDTGAWSLIRTATKKADVTLASDTVAALGTLQWHRLTLSFSGSTITPAIDDKPLPPITDSAYASGMIGLGTLNYALAQFDNLRIAPAPEAGPSAPK
ncbi:MAG: hypothetical protein ABR910_09380, partial [Acidobacteriaceae bacterium]